MTYQLYCAICRRPVNIEESKTDEHGHAVHENCYVWTVELKKPRRPITQMEHSSTIASVLSLRSCSRRNSEAVGFPNRSLL